MVLKWWSLARLFVICMLILLLTLTVVEAFGSTNPMLRVAVLIALAIAAGASLGMLSNLVRKQRAGAATRERP